MQASDLHLVDLSAAFICISFVWSCPAQPTDSSEFHLHKRKFQLHSRAGSKGAYILIIVFLYCIHANL